MEQLVILGLGARSTLFYQDVLHKLHLKKVGGYASFPFILKQLDFNRINPFLPNDTSVISPILRHELRAYDSLENALLVPNISIHKILDTIDFKLTVVHPYKLLVKELEHRAEKKLVFFGTKFTHNESYLSTYITNRSIETLSSEEVLFLDKLRKGVYNCTESIHDIEKYKSLIDKYANDHIVIIACTELSIINTVKHINLIDLALLQCEASLAIATAGM